MLLAPERLSELRRAVEAPKSGPGYHHVSNEELSELPFGFFQLAVVRAECDQLEAERDAAQEELADIRLCDQRARALLAGALGVGEDATQPIDVLAASVHGEMVGARKNLENALGRAPQGPERFSLPVLAIEVYRLLKKARTERDVVDADLGESLAEARAQRAGVERELLEVRAELARVLGDAVSSYMTPVGLARAVASRVEELRERMRRQLEQARTGKFAGPPQDARLAAKEYSLRRQAEKRAAVARINAGRVGALPCGAYGVIGAAPGDADADATSASPAPAGDSIIAGSLRALLSSIGLAPPDVWIDGAAAALLQAARLAGAAGNVGHRPALSDEDVELIIASLEEMHRGTVDADVVERALRLIRMLEGLLDDDEDIALERAVLDGGLA